MCVCGSGVVFFPSSPSPPSFPFSSFALGRSGGREPSVLELRVLLPGRLWEQLCPEQRVRPGCWAPVRAAPLCLMRDVQGNGLGSKFFGANKYSSSAPALPKNNLRCDDLRMCNAPANLHRGCVSQSECQPSPAHSTLFSQIFGLL